MTEGTAFVIRELTGRKRSVTLMGRAGPFRGPTWGVQQRTKKTKYAGSPVATLQLFGLDVDVPTTISGMWHDRYLGNPLDVLVLVTGFASPTTAEQMIALFEDLVRAGATLEVSWGFYLRVGVLKRFVGKPDRVEDVAWEAEFEWESDGKTKAPRPKFPDAPKLDRVRQTMTQLSDHAAYDPLDTLQAFEARLFAAVDALQERVESLLDTARGLATALTLPARVVVGVQQAATSIAFGAGQIIEEVIGAPYLTMQVIDDLASVLTAEAWRRDLASYCDELRHASLSVSDAFTRRLEPDPVRIVRADQTGSLRRIAQDEYGQGDAWQLLADANGFEGAFVPPGTEVWVPPSPGPVGVT
jgi:hypothetical protein